MSGILQAMLGHNDGGVTYASWNPSDKGSTVTLSNSNLTATFPSSTVQSARATIGKSSGKWYWEIKQNGDVTGPVAGISRASMSVSSMWVGGTSDSWSEYIAIGRKYNAGSGAVYGSTGIDGSVLGIALDMDGKTITFYIDGANQGVAFTGLSGTVFPTVSQSGGFYTCNFVANFGATPFTYSVPGGYNAGLY